MVKILIDYYIKKYFPDWDNHEIDHSLEVSEQFTELREKLGLNEPKPYCKEFEEYIERQQKKSYNSFCRKHYNKNRNKLIKPILIGNTYYSNSKFNLVSTFKKTKQYKRKIRKQLYKRFKLTRRLKRNCFNIDKICRRLPNL